MYEYIKGELVLVTPAYAVLDVHGIGYKIIISLQTYTKLADATTAKLNIHQIIREDANLLYGFFDEDERHIFRLLINVNGVGANTALIMLSSLSSEEIRAAILKEDINTLKGVKGIGLKTAQRIVVDLRDKITTTGASVDLFTRQATGNEQKEEALLALITMGYTKAAAEKVLDKLLKATKYATVQELLKAAFKQM
ncbi:MAG: Holliday junction branch migration protein RuvA [Prevotellaceae bacterium]|jgi:Holliday junction DNA helicase RuvA|nr:Holliday junction branch migration protein RuvA [Prevotellaceae bacterium]